MRQESNTTWTDYSPSSHRLSSVLRRYAPISLIIVTGLMLTAVILSIAESSALGIVVAGVGFTCLFAVYMVLLIGRKAQVEQTVIERAADLEREINERKQAEVTIQEQYDEIQIHAFELEAANHELRHTQEKILELNQFLEENVKARTVELEDVNKDLEAFIYSVSHDLRAPLRHINGFSRILQSEHSGQLSEEAMRYLDKIAQSASNMGNLVDGLLNLSRIGRKPLELEKVDLNSVVDGVKLELEPEIGNRDIEWKIEPLPEIECDFVLMKQVVVNLLSNAVKFTRNSDGVVIEVKPLSSGESGFMVKDNGAGFDMEYTEKLFGVFERLHRKEDFEGTGIGLATVHRIVDNHNGRVWAEAEVNKGATFYVELPHLHEVEKEVSRSGER